MPNVYMDKNSIRIELTQGEAASYGFALNRPQLIRKTRGNSGGLVLELISVDLTKSVDSSEVVVWIPPAQTFPGSSACQEALTTRPGALRVLNGRGSYTEDFTRPYSNVSGHHPHGADWSRGTEAEAAIGAGISTSSAGEPEISS